MKTVFLLRITLVLFLLFLPPEIFAQDIAIDESEQESGEDFVLQVFLQTSLGTLTVGAPWTLTIYVNHGVPDEVTVVIPAFAPSLFLDRIVKTPGMKDAQVQTVIEFRFIPNSPGRFFIEPFTVITPHGIAETVRYILDVRNISAEPGLLTPRIVWEGYPPRMAAGERTVIILRITGRDLSSRLPPPDFFMPEIPRGAILIPSPLSAEEKENGCVIKLSLIPLETGDFVLPARLLQYENIVFQIPSLNINITSPIDRMPPRSGIQAGRQNDLSAVETSAAEIIQFPDINLIIFDSGISKSRRRQCESIYNKANYLWDNGFHAQALAELRRNERYHPAGGVLRPIRQEAEKNIGFFNTGNESRVRQLMLLILTFSFLALVIISIFVCFFIKRGMFVKRASLICAVIFAAAGIFCFFRYFDSNALFSGSRFGVTNETPVRRTADYEGEELFRFREGQPVLIMLNSGAWVYVRANDAEGKSGWLPAEEVIFY